MKASPPNIMVNISDGSSNQESQFKNSEAVVIYQTHWTVARHLCQACHTLTAMPDH
jgi:hypothetical protein